MKFTKRIVQYLDVNRKWKAQLTALTHKRKPKTREEILREYTDSGLKPEFAPEVIDFLQDYLPLPAFPIRANDDIPHDYGVDPEDLSDFYTELLRRRQIPLPGRKQQSEFLKGKVRYPVSLAIEFLQWCEQQHGNRH